jgi:hypothetical protein
MLASLLAYGKAIQGVDCIKASILALSNFPYNKQIQRNCLLVLYGLAEIRLAGLDKFGRLCSNVDKLKEIASHGGVLRVFLALKFHPQEPYIVKLGIGLLYNFF